MKKGFSLVELLAAVGIVAILATVTMITLNPAEILKQSRDATRVADMNAINKAISLYYSEALNDPSTLSMGSSSVVYVSIPSNSTTCQGIDLPVLPATYTYHCAPPDIYRSVNGAGWIPVDLDTLSAGAPVTAWPVDPINSSSPTSHLYYTYTTDGTHFEVTAVMESAKYQLGGSNDVVANDGGPLATVYEKGTKLGLEPVDYGDPTLVGYWPLNEGTGTIAYDGSGNGNNGTWNGAQTGADGYYNAGTVQAYTGAFNGDGDYIALGSSTTIEPGAVGTYSAWIDPAVDCNATMGWGVIVADDDTYYDKGGVALYCDNTGNIMLELGSSTDWNAINTPLVRVTPNVWQFFAGTWDGSMAKLYDNGVLVATSTQTFAPNPIYPTYIGSGSGIGLPSTDTFQGDISNVRIYNRALSAAEIAAMYKGGK